VAELVALPVPLLVVVAVALFVVVALPA